GPELCPSMAPHRGVREDAHAGDLSAQPVRRHAPGQTADADARHDRRVRTRPDYRAHPARPFGESPPWRIYALGIPLLRLPVFAKTAWLPATGGARDLRSRGRPGALSRVGGGTAELSSNHQTAERLQNAHAYRPKHRVAISNGPQHSHQPCLCWTGAVQLSAARDPPVSQDGGTPPPVTQDGAQLSCGKRMDLERSPGHYYR